MDNKFSFNRPKQLKIICSFLCTQGFQVFTDSREWNMCRIGAKNAVASSILSEDFKGEKFAFDRVTLPRLGNILAPLMEVCAICAPA